MSISPTVRAPRAVQGIHRTWDDARRLAHDEGSRLAGRTETDIVLLAEAGGRTLAHDLFALTDLPRASASAMDGWAISGDGPWELGTPIRAGDHTPRRPLGTHEARPIATGAPVPPGATSVLRNEHGDVRYSAGVTLLHLRDSHSTPRPGHDIRLAGEEMRRGEPILSAGTILTSPRLALAAAAGFDEVTVAGIAPVDLVLLGDELRSSGVPTDGETRDAFVPALPSAIRNAGGALAGTWFGPDSLDATVAALRATSATLVVTTGGTARGPMDFVRPALDTIGARIVCDGVAMRPGHPVIIAQLRDGRLLLALPGNPLAAMLAFASLGVPLLSGLTGRGLDRTAFVTLACDIANATGSTRLVPCVVDHQGATPTAWQGTAMLRGLASADVVAVIPAGGAEAGGIVRTLPLPW